jgi:hypothetical protein
VYAFCHRNISGAVTVAILNIGSSTTQIVLDAPFAGNTRLEYHLTPPNGNVDVIALSFSQPAPGDVTSAEIELNGVVLIASPEGALPPLKPTTVTDNSPIAFAPLTYGFVVFPEAGVSVCKQS